MRVAITIAAITGGLLLGTTPAQAHSRAELDAFMAQAEWGLSAAVLAEMTDLATRHPWYFNPAPVATQSASSGSGADTGMGNGDVERWRSLAAQYFAAGDLDTLLCLMGHESGGNPDAFDPSGARGLMQVLGGWADHYGTPKSALFDPATNLEISARLRASGSMSI